MLSIYHQLFVHLGQQCLQCNIIDDGNYEYSYEDCNTSGTDGSHVVRGRFRVWALSARRTQTFELLYRFFVQIPVQTYTFRTNRSKWSFGFSTLSLIGFIVRSC